MYSIPLYVVFSFKQLIIGLHLAAEKAPMVNVVAIGLNNCENMEDMSCRDWFEKVLQK